MLRDDIQRENDPDRLRALALALETDNRLLLARLKAVTEQLAAATGQKQQALLADELRKIQERLATSNAEHFGLSRSERRGRPGDNEKPPKAEKKKRPGHGPRKQPKLPIVEVLHPFDEADRVCPDCGGTFPTMAGQFETSEEITVVERHYVLVVHQREKCRCPSCGTIETAEGPDKLIPGGRYSLDFAVSVALDKYQSHQPLARQVARMEQLGLDVTTATLWDQLSALYRVLLPSYLALKKHVLQADVVYADETTWRVMDEGPSEKWWAWEIATEDAAWFTILPGRSADEARLLFEGYSGIVMADGFGAYGALEYERDRTPGRPQPLLTDPDAPPPLPLPNFMLVTCWMHARRPLFKAEKNYPEATEALDLIAGLYAVEDEAQEAARGDPVALREARARLRAERSRPLVEKLRQWVEKQTPIPDSQLDKGVRFLQKDWTGLTRFLEDGRIPLDNGLAERDQRTPVLGRKNHQGSRSEAGTRVSALFYSLLLSCRRVGLDPAVYLAEAARRALRNPGTVTLPHALAAELRAAASAEAAQA